MSDAGITTSAGSRELESARTDASRVRPRRIRIIASPSVDVSGLEPILRALAARGHRIQLAVVTGKTPPVEAQRIAAELPLVRTVPAYPRRDDWTPLVEGLRSPGAFSSLSQRPILGSQWGTAALAHAASWVEGAIPTVAAFDEEIFTQALDLVIATAGADVSLDWLLSARRAGVRTALLATAWNDFADIHARHVPVDRALVWNEAQRSMAIARLGLPADRAVTVGASHFDAWFDPPPALDRTAFLTGLGLPADRSTILFAADADPASARRWIQALRDTVHPEVRDASVLVRMRQSARDDLHDVPGVARVDRSAIVHADCVVTADPAVAVESAIAERPALSLPGTRVPAGLAREHGGPLLGSRTSAEHFAQLAQALSGPAPSGEAFLARFVRPRGLDRPVAPAVADAIEDLLTEPWPTPARRTHVQQAVQPVLWLAACSPRLPRTKGLRRSKRAERMAAVLARASALLTDRRTNQG